MGDLKIGFEPTTDQRVLMTFYLPNINISFKVYDVVINEEEEGRYYVFNGLSDYVIINPNSNFLVYKVSSDFAQRDGGDMQFTIDNVIIEDMLEYLDILASEYKNLVTIRNRSSIPRALNPQPISKDDYVPISKDDFSDDEDEDLYGGRSKRKIFF